MNHIIDLSRIEADKLKLERTCFELRDMLGKIYAALSEKAVAKGLEMVLDIDPALPATLYGDSLRLSQILLNLVSNAVKFTEHGSISLRIRKIEETSDDALIRFEVRDTGAGIAAEAQNRLFEAFEQADGSTTRKYGGIGLGLTISRRLAEMMGGTVGVESKPEVGSTFWLTARMDKVAGDTDQRVVAIKREPAPATSDIPDRLIPGCDTHEEVAMEIDSNRAQEAKEIDLDRAQETLARLEALLAVDDARASAVFRETAPLLRAALGVAAQVLEQQINKFEYDQALRTLRELTVVRATL